MTNRTLWVLQILLALLFLFAGGVKLVMPIDALTKQTPMLSGGFLRFIGVCEVLGGLGLILPGLLHRQEWLTPLAALCLVGIMIGAVTVTLMTSPVPMAVLPFAVALLLVWVAVKRRPGPKTVAAT